MDTGEKNEEIDIAEFIQGVENLRLLRWLTEQPLAKLATWRVALQFLVFDRTWFKQLRVLVLMGNVWAVVMYGVWEDQPIDIILYVFVCVYAVEVAMRIVAYGPHLFWNYASYTHSFGDDALWEQMANRADFLVVALAWTFCTIVLIGECAKPNILIHAYSR